MSKVNVEYDTKEKAISVSIDGKPVDNLRSVDFYHSYDDDEKFRFRLVTAVSDAENDMRLMTHVVASEGEASELDGFFIQPNIIEQIQAAFKC